MAATDDSATGELGKPTGVPGEIWLDGEVLACACPDCGAPMSIRLWLLLADCFRCGASVELTYQQELEARRLLAAHQQRQEQAAREAAATIHPTAARPAKRPPLVAPAPRATRSSPVKPPPAPPAQPRRPRRLPAAYAHRLARARARPTSPGGVARALGGQLLRTLPAWLVSLVTHLILVLLLGLWIVERPTQPLAIFLSTAVSYQDLEGETGRLHDLDDAFEFDQPGGVELATALEDTPGVAEGLALAEALPTEVPRPVPTLPGPASLPPVRLEAPPVGRMFLGRDPELRGNLVEREGGTSFTEAAVTRGLVWIARHQNEDGSWSLDDFARSPGCRGQCGGGGGVHSDVAGTALALLPMLGAGQTHTEGEHTAAVFAGLRWLVAQQREDGDLRGTGGGRMYAQGLAAIALCEAYGLTGDSQLREPAQKALDFIIAAEHPRGGWRYEPRQPADTSVVGWQLMALRSGQMAGLVVPSTAFAGASEYLDRAQTDRRGGSYAYMPGQAPTVVMTAEALLCRQYLGWPREHPGLVGGVRFLLKCPPEVGAPNVYYWYYASQVLHHVGGSEWTQWNDKMRVVLSETQETRGHEAGSWAPRGEFAPQGGRLYMTALAVCTLEVYYRHLPLYRPEVLGDFVPPSRTLQPGRTAGISFLPIMPSSTAEAKHARASARTTILAGP